jgi:hypothetical protein
MLRDSFNHPEKIPLIPNPKIEAPAIHNKEL